MIAASSIGAPRRRLKGTDLFSGVTGTDVPVTPENRSVPFNLLQASDHRAVTPRLWLALYLPRFPLEVLGAERAAILPVVVISGSGAGRLKKVPSGPKPKT